MITSEKNKYKITYSQILDSTLFLSIMMSVIARHTILDDLSKVTFIGLVFLLRQRKIDKIFNIYFALEVIFILYCYAQIKTGIAININVAMEKIKTLVICLVYYISIYMYILGSSKKERVVEILVKSIFYGLIVVLLCDFKNIFAGRFTSAGINIVGIRIGQLNSTYIGHLSGIALYMALLIYWKENKKKATLYTIFFTLIILISGTRKMLIMIIIAMIIIPYIYNSRKNLIKLLIRIMLALVMIVIGYKFMMNIPILYNSIGIRVENVVDAIVNGSTDESSFNTRAKLIEKGMIAFEEKPTYGWGLDNFRYVINKGGYYAHNNFVEILVSGGKVGFFIYYSKYLYLILLTFICKKRKTKDEYNKIKGFRVLLITLIILEYWQVTYYYRLFILPFIITLAFSHKNLKIEF